MHRFLITSRYTADTVWVNCPYCLEEHQYTYDVLGAIRQFAEFKDRSQKDRARRCVKVVKPNLLFFRFVWEVGKWRTSSVIVETYTDLEANYLRFRTVGLKNHKTTENDLSLETAKVMEDLEQMALGADERPNQEHIDRLCIACDTNQIRSVVSLLKTFPELINMSDRYGNTALHHVACKGHRSLAQFLMTRKGVNLDHANAVGRTPLMEAALWGQIDVVQTLMNHGAKTLLSASRCSQKLTAYDFAEDTIANEKERYDRRALLESSAPQLELPRYLEMQDRQTIRELLAGCGLERSKFEAADEVAFVKAYANDDNVLMTWFLDVGTGVPISDCRKTVARLDRGNLLPVTYACSGRTRRDRPERGFHILDEKEMEEVVLTLSILLDYPMDPYFRSHAEVQLMAHYVQQHCLLPGLRQDGKASEQLLSLAHLQQSLGMHKDKHSSRFDASIQVAHASEVCSSCTNLAKTIKERLGIRFELRLVKQLETTKVNQAPGV